MPHGEGALWPLRYDGLMAASSRGRYSIRGQKRTGKKSHINILPTILGLDVLFLALCGPPGPQIDTKKFTLWFFWPPDGCTLLPLLLMVVVVENGPIIK